MVTEGQRYERLTVVALATGKRRTMAHVICDCGTEKLVQPHALTSGTTRSCGCLAREMASAMAKRPGWLDAARAAHFKHGAVATAEYRIWNSMKRRCYTQTTKNYYNYGGRGIAMCDSWRRSFAAFLADMGPRPSSRHSIDRIDVNGNYEPGNCRWADSKTQGRNKRDTLWVQLGAERATLKALCEDRQLPYAAVWKRIKRGWTAEQALAHPMRAQEAARRLG